jgi:autotransporter passenger strand-loop-strand repeat protein
MAEKTYTSHIYVGYDGFKGGFDVGSGTLLAVEGGTARGFTVLNGGAAFVNPYGFPGDDFIRQDAPAKIEYATISSGGTVLLRDTSTSAVITTIQAGGTMVLNGGTAFSSTVMRGGVEIVQSNTPATVYRAFGGPGSSVDTVLNGGTEIVTAGATVYNLTDNGGLVRLSSGAYVDRPMDLNSGALLYAAGAHILTDIYLRDSIANDVAIGPSDSPRILYVEGGSTEIGTFVGSGSTDLVSAGGKALNTTLDTFGHEFVTGGVTTGTRILAGTVAYSGDTTIVDGGGEQTVYAGGTALKTVAVGGGLFVSSGGVTLSAVLESEAGEGVSSGGVAISSVVSDGGSIHAYAGGLASNTDMVGGYLLVSSGGVANGTVMNGGATLVFGGGSAINTTVDGGGLVTGKVAGAQVAEPAVLSNTHVYAGYVVVSSSDVATRTVLSTSSATLYDDGGHVFDTILSGGFLGISSAGVAARTSLYNGKMIVSSGGGASSLYVAGGLAEIAAGGSAANLGVYSGTAVISGVVSKSIVEGGRLFIFGEATDTAVTSSGTVFVKGLASGTTVFGGVVSAYGGGLASGTTILGGVVGVYNGGLAIGTVVLGGVLNVYSGGTATAVGDGGGKVGVQAGGVLNAPAGSTTIAAPNMVELGSGSTAQGTIAFTSGVGLLEIDSGANMSATISGFTNGGTIDFTQLAYQDSGTAVLNPETGVLTVSEDGQTETLHLAGAGSGASFQLSQDAGGMGTDVAVSLVSTVTGASGTVYGASGGNVVLGGAGNLLFIGGLGAVSVFGGSGSTTLFGSMGASATSLLVGGTGSNLMRAGAGASTLIGGSGTNVLYAFGPAGNVFIAGAGATTVNGTMGTGPQQMFTGAGTALMALNGVTDTVVGGSGDSSIQGGAGQDIYGFVESHAGGTEVIFGLKANDILVFGGYGAAPIASEKVVEGSDHIMLTDGTVIVLQDIAHTLFKAP